MPRRRFIAVAAVERARRTGGARLRLAVSAIRLRGKVDLPQGERVVAADASGDGTLVALALSSGKVEIRAIPSLEVIKEYRIRELKAPEEIRYSDNRGSLLLRWPDGKGWTLSTDTWEHDVVPAATDSEMALDPYGNGVFSFKADAAVLIDKDSLSEKKLRRCSHGEPIASLAIDGRVLLAERSGGAKSGKVEVCDALVGKVVRQLDLGGRSQDQHPFGWLFSQDGRLLVAGDIGAEEVHVWDVQTGKNVTLRDFTSPPRGLKFGRDRTLIVDLSDGVVEVWKLSGLDPGADARNELISAPQSVLLRRRYCGWPVRASGDGLSVG
jgi:WD40 repeat protein